MCIIQIIFLSFEQQFSYDNNICNPIKYDSMWIEVLKSKIHRAKVTGADLNYSGSITIDEAWMQKADLVEFEKVQVLNINNGERFETYVIKGRMNSKEIILNGAAARKVQVGDLVIILSYTWIDKKEYDRYNPVIFIADVSS